MYNSISSHEPTTTINGLTAHLSVSTPFQIGCSSLQNSMPLQKPLADPSDPLGMQPCCSSRWHHDHYQLSYGWINTTCDGTWLLNCQQSKLQNRKTKCNEPQPQLVQRRPGPCHLKHQEQFHSALSAKLCNSWSFAKSEQIANVHCDSTVPSEPHDRRSPCHVTGSILLWDLIICHSKSFKSTIKINYHQLSTLEIFGASA